jgi:hypothetical protein
MPETSSVISLAEEFTYRAELAQQLQLTNK